MMQTLYPSRQETIKGCVSEKTSACVDSVSNTLSYSNVLGTPATVSVISCGEGNPSEHLSRLSCQL